ncbi:class I SAM-dependent methyltransferase [Saccharopolyspora sp. HNM0983]|uniref:Class I SAM-dependent methyltransferase n=1 Tax=Saccharopolyspora montiporae TaxID=2781240 RepID=A0A929BCH2_9PSEU|nr:class I SAM-dependent methyltransferase [Saccharopolyspora sp. HNM0983]
MGYSFDLRDVAFLRSSAGADALARLDEWELTAATRLTDVARARSLVGERFAAAVLETGVLRRRARSKLTGADSWLLTDPALQQATATRVAEHRAERLAGRDVHDVTCSIGADAEQLAAVARTCVASDLDPVRLAMAEHNLAARGREVVLVRADALQPATRGTAVVADPARRDDTGRRRWNPAELEPPLDDLLAAYAGRDLVVKAAPGLDFDAVPDEAEVEIVSMSGQVREASLWFGDLAESGVRRRGTVLTGEGAWTITDREPDDCPVIEAGEWIVDPDGAVVRAGLVRQYAVRWGLGQLDPHIAYLTGPRPPAGVRAFRVQAQVRFREKALRALLRSHDVGSAEILVRGVDVDPDALRKRLKLTGSASATVVLTRIGDTATAFLCRAERT